MRRRRLPAEQVVWLVIGMSLIRDRSIAHVSADRDRWRGLALYGVDGSTLWIPDSNANRAHFGSQSACKRGDTGYPMVRMVAVMALRSHLLACVCFGPYKTDERQYAKALGSTILEESLVLLDRNYLQASALVGLASTGRHWMTPAKSNTKWTLVERLGKDDLLVELTVSSDARRKDPSLLAQDLLPPRG